MRATACLSLVALALAGTFAAGCGGESPKSGVTAYLRVAGGQYVDGELTADVASTEPVVNTIKSANTHVFPGALSRTVTGTTNEKAVAVLIGLEGDDAHWILPTAHELDDNQILIGTFSASVSYSPDLPTGTRALRVRAVDADGNLGPLQSLSLKVELPSPTGALVIQLTWDTEADLDLRVRITDPTAKAGYFDVWNKAPLALPPRSSSATPYTAAQIAAAGKFQFDSNAQCIIDGQRHEEVIFPGVVPPGPYEVRVDTASLCAEPTARWHVAAFTNPAGIPTLIQEAFGQSTDRDTIATHGADSGVLAFTFSQ